MESERPDPVLEKCPYCGGRFENPCDEPPPDTCEQALRYTAARVLFFMDPNLKIFP